MIEKNRKCFIEISKPNTGPLFYHNAKILKLDSRFIEFIDARTGKIFIFPREFVTQLNEEADTDDEG